MTKSVFRVLGVVASLAVTLTQIFLTLCLASCGNEPDSTVVRNAYKSLISDMTLLQASVTEKALKRYQLGINPLEDLGAMGMSGSMTSNFLEQPASFKIINSYSREQNGETLFIYKCSMEYKYENFNKKNIETDGKIIPSLSFALVKRGKEWFMLTEPN